MITSQPSPACALFAPNIARRVLHRANRCFIAWSLKWNRCSKAPTRCLATMPKQFDQRKSLSPRLGFRERVSGFVFASRFHFFAAIILSAAEISSKVGAFHRRTVQPPALAR